MPSNYFLLCFFPLIFYCFISTKSIQNKYKSYLSVKIITILSFLKFVILPVLMVSSGYYNVFPESNIDIYVTQTLSLMIFEIVSVFFVLKFYKPKRFHQKLIKSKKQNKKIVTIAIFIGLLGLLIYPDFIKNIIWLKSSDDLLLDNVTFIIGWQMGILYYFVKFVPVIILILTITYLRNKGFKKYKLIKLTTLLIISLFTVVLVFSENRGHLVAQGILIIYLLSNYFPKYKRSLSISIFSVILLGVIFSTSYRILNSNKININTSSSILNYYNGELGIRFIDAYLSGPSSLAQGLKAYDLYENNWSFNTFINDIIINTQVLNQISYRIFDTNLLKDRTSVYYAKIITGSRIPPLMMSGYIYLGFLFAPLFAMIAVFLALRFEDFSKYFFKNDVFMSFVWLYISIRFSFFLGLSISVLYGLFATYFLPMWLVFKLNNNWK